MGLNIGAVLAALGGGATAAGTAMDEREEKLRRQQIEKALQDMQMVEFRDKYGLTEEVPEEVPDSTALTNKAIAQLSATKPNLQAAGGMGMPALGLGVNASSNPASGPSYTQQRDAQIGPPQARQKPDIVSIGPKRFVRDPSQSAKVRDAKQAIIDAELKGGAEIRGKFNAMRDVVPGEAPGRTAERIGAWPRGEGDTQASRLQRATLSAAQRQAQFEAANALKLRMQKATLENARVTAGMRAGRADNFEVRNQVNITTRLLSDVASQARQIQGFLVDPFLMDEQKAEFSRQLADLQKERQDLTAQLELLKGGQAPAAAAPAVAPPAAPKPATAKPPRKPVSSQTGDVKTFLRQWGATNPRQQGETTEAYAERARAAWRAAGN